MIRIWAKTTKNNVVTRNIIYESIDSFKEDVFYKHIQKICEKLDIPAPIIIKSHIDNYVDFNNCIFLPRDFVESIDFEKLILENVVTNN